MFYTKREACEKLLEGTPAESIARIEAEREGRKYYLVTAYTPYCGEEMEAYFSSCDEESLRVVYENKLTDYHVVVKEIPWYG